METHSDKIFGVVEKLTSKSYSEVGCISAFFFLHFACHLKHFSSRMLNFELFEDGSSITGDESFIDMVDNHFFQCYDRIKGMMKKMDFYPFVGG